MAEEVNVEKDTLINQQENEAPELQEEEKTPEPDQRDNQIKTLQSQVATLQAQKEHWRDKAQKGATIINKTPSEAEMAQVIPDWEYLSPQEQTLAKEVAFLKKEISSLKEMATGTARKITFDEQFSELSRNFPLLAGKKAEFKEHCESEEPTEKLAKSFLYDVAKEIGAIEEKEKMERPGLEIATGGIKTEPKPKAKGITAEEAQKLRKSDPRKYNEMIRMGKLPPILD